MADEEVVDFSFIVKSVEGQIQLVPSPDNPPTMIDLFNSTAQIQRDLNAQHIAGMIQQAMFAAAQAAAQQNPDAASKSTGGVILPNG